METSLSIRLAKTQSVQLSYTGLHGAEDMLMGLESKYVFNYPGLGLLFYNSLGNEDYPVLIAYTLIGALLTVGGNLLADIALTIADPRIRLS